MLKNLIRAIGYKGIFFLLLLSINLKCIAVKVPDSDQDFIYYGLEYGISSIHINDIYQDSLGFIWVGTLNGLNRFDGNTFKPYLEDLSISKSLANNNIRVVTRKDEENIWLGTNNGLYLFNKRKENFKSYHQTNDSLGLSFGEITDLLVDKKTEDLWITTDGNGINKYVQEKNKFIHYKEEVFAEEYLGATNILGICEDDKRNVWFATWRGLIFHDYQTKKFNRLLFDDFKEYGIPHNHVFGLSQLDSTTFWLELGKGVQMIHQPDTTIFSWKDMQAGRVHDIFKDSDDYIWVAGSNGISVFKKSENEYVLVKRLLIGKEILCFLLDKQKNFWIGTTSGLYMIPADIKVYKELTLSNIESPVSINAIIENHRTKDLLCFSSNHMFTLDSVRSTKENSPKKLPTPVRNVKFIIPNDDSTLLLSKPNGLYEYDFIANEEKRLVDFAKEPIKDYAIRNIFKDKTNRLWLSTTLKVYSFDLSDFQNTFRKYVHQYNTKGISYFHSSTDIVEDKYGHIWIGTLGSGLEEYIPDQDLFIHHLNVPSDKSSVLSNFIFIVKLDKQGNIWVGHSAGISCYLINEKRFKNYYSKNSSKGESVNNLLFDSYDNIWYTTSKGLFYLDVEKELITEIFSKSEEYFNRKSASSAFDGELFFGTHNGVLNVSPDLVVKNNDIIAPFYFQSFITYSDHGSGVTQDIIYQNSIKLKNRKQNIKVLLNTLSYSKVQDNRFEVFLEGVDEKPYVINGNELYYSYLPYGNSTLKVTRLADHETISLKINVLTPWWRTTLALAIYLFLFTVIVIVLYRESRNRNRRKINREKTKQEGLFNKERIKLFTYISHELKTPLTLILSPIKEFLNSDSSFSRSDAKLVYKNAEHLQELIYELLDFQSLVSNQQKLSLSYENIDELIKSLCSRFEYIAKKEGITFEVQIPFGINSWVDKEKLKKIIMNLLSNAFKHCRSSVKLSLEKTLDKGTERLKINCWDDGVGIKANQLEKIFDPYYTNFDSAIQKGTGLGLSITKQLVELLKGEINVHSKEGENCQFVVSLNLTELSANKENDFSNQLVNINDESKKEFKNKESDNPNPSILVVEDNQDIREYLHNRLSKNYTIHIAENGELGFEKATELLPDVIISDVMMPKMDGVELTQKLKSTFVTSHIPIILLTAKYQKEDIIQGLLNGADYYLPKPFDISELQIRLNNIFTLKESINERFISEYKLGLVIHTTNPDDKEFLDMTIKFIEESILKSELNVNSLVDFHAMSYTSVLDKVKSLTGLTVNELIETVRLKKAADILRANSGIQIKEVAYLVGFTDQRYFSKRFKAFHGQTPSSFIQK